MFLNLGFSNAWWNKLYSLDFSEYIYMDPLEKVRCQDFMDSVIRERFGRLHRPTLVDEKRNRAAFSSEQIVLYDKRHLHR